MMQGVPRPTDPDQQPPAAEREPGATTVAPEDAAALAAALEAEKSPAGGATGSSDSDAGMVEIHPSLPKVNPDLVFGATMALWRPPRFTPQELLDTINEILDGTGAIAEFDEKMKQAGRQQKFSLLKRRLRGPPSAMLRVNGLCTLVGGGDKPAFVGKAPEERTNPALWSEGVQRLS